MDKKLAGLILKEAKEKQIFENKLKVAAVKQSCPGKPDIYMAGRIAGRIQSTYAKYKNSRSIRD